MPPQLRVTAKKEVFKFSVVQAQLVLLLTQTADTKTRCASSSVGAATVGALLLSVAGAVHAAGAGADVVGEP